MNQLLALPLPIRDTVVKSGRGGKLLDVLIILSCDAKNGKYSITINRSSWDDVISYEMHSKITEEAVWWLSHMIEIINND